MKKKIAATLLLVAMSFAAAHADTGKLVYTNEQLVKEEANSIPGIVEKYMGDTGRKSLIDPARFLLLLNGIPAQDAAKHLEKADRVEVLTDGESLVINVVTMASSGGA
jgi:hypothetical protein